MKKSEQYFPQLVVGLSSLDEHAQWVHISQAKMDEVYYCPCCKGEIKPRAIKEGQTYHMQPHFYHSSGGCSEETYVHYICKTFLFENGCKFIVNGIEYEVENVELEKTLSTSFGNYKPDIIVTTTEGKTFYFEIRSTNKKTQHYIPKWDELGNDVVEVNTSDCVNQRFSTGVPEFNLIYSNGECFIKSYIHKDYDEAIAKRKLHWKRQEVLDYKIQWERLDWFWTELQNYAVDKSREEIVMKCFNQLEYDDKIWCYENVKKKWCVDLKDKFRDNINQHFFDYVNSFAKDGIQVEIEHISPKIYEVIFRYNFIFDEYILFEDVCVRVKIGKGNIFDLSDISIGESVSLLRKKIDDGIVFIDKITKIKDNDYVHKVKPISTWYANNYCMHDMKYKIIFHENIENDNQKTIIGNCEFYMDTLDKINVEETFLQLKSEALEKYNRQEFKNALANNIKFQCILKELKEIGKEINIDFYIEINESGYYKNRRAKRCVIMTSLFFVKPYCFNLPYISEFGKFEDDMFDFFLIQLKKELSYYNACEKNYAKAINQCKNNIWSAHMTFSSIRINLLDVDAEIISSRSIRFTGDDMKNQVTKTMNDMLKYAENYKGIRFLEAN